VGERGEEGVWPTPSAPERYKGGGLVDVMTIDDCGSVETTKLQLDDKKSYLSSGLKIPQNSSSLPSVL
jgi:hypothetical protein